MKYKQLMEEMRKQSGLSRYYFEMLRSIGPDWEEFTENYCAYNMFQCDSAQAELTMIKKAKELGERLGYICGRIREFNENY